MRFSQLSIQTQRETPSNARTPGFAFLTRAGYLTRDGQPLELARLTLENVRRLHARMAGTMRRVAATGPAPELAKSFFARLGLPVVASRETDEFYFLLTGGADEIVQCAACGYASQRALARSDKQAGAQHAAPLPAVEKVFTPDCSTIDSLANFLGIPREKTAKALMYTRPSDGKFVFIVVRGDMQLSEAKLRRLIGEVRPATPAEIEAGGAVAGYASPIGLRDALVVVDDLIPRSPDLVAGANEAGYHFKNVNVPRDFEPDLTADVILPERGDPCPECGAPLEVRAAETLSTGGEVRFEALLLPLAETHHDDKGLTLPAGVAPFDVYLMNVPGKALDTASEAGNVYARLRDAGIAVLYDDRDERAGVKFNDADLLGCPLRITVGERGLQNGVVELKPRKAGENQAVAMTDLLDVLKNLQS